MMQQSDDNDGTDLEFTTSVDESVIQHVPFPPPTNNVLSNMIAGNSTESSIHPVQPASYSASLPGFSFLKQSSHPTACLFHVLFKALAFIIYILGSKFMEDIMVTVICIFLNAADFWVVKNITGRLLVGLRWWNKVDPSTGKTSWIFESAVPTSPNTAGASRASVNSFDSTWFWTILYVTPLLWILFFVTAILWLQFQCFVTLSCALILSWSNVYGYYKCSSDQRQKMQDWMNTGANFGIRAMVRNGMVGRLSDLLGGNSGRQQVPQQDVFPGTFA